MSKKMIKSKFFSIAFTLVLTSTLVACNGEQNTEDHSIQQTKEAEVIYLQQDSATIYKSYPATIAGKNNIEMRPQISGYIEQIYIDEGQYVPAGTILFSINATAYLEQKNQAIAALNAAKSQLATAKLDLDKYQNLATTKVFSDFQQQRAQTNYDAASNIVKQQEALLASAQVNLSYTTIKAPISGYVGRLPKKVGALISPTDPIALTTLSEVNQVFVYFSLSETDILAIHKSKPGKNLQEKLKSFDQIQLQLADGSFYGNQGQIDMLDGQYNSQTAAITVRASFNNPEHLLRTGNTGKIILKTVENDVIKIPVLASYELQDKIIVGRLNPNHEVEYIPLQDYTKSGENYIVKTGFQVGDQIIAKELALIPEKTIIKDKSKK